MPKERASRYEEPELEDKPRERKRPSENLSDLNPGSIPEQWQNGSGYYREGTAHLKSDEGLMGRTHNLGPGRVKAWRYLGKDKYFYLGEFGDGHAARQEISRRSKS